MAWLGCIECRDLKDELSTINSDMRNRNFRYFSYNKLLSERRRVTNELERLWAASPPGSRTSLWSTCWHANWIAWEVSWKIFNEYATWLPNSINASRNQIIVRDMGSISILHLGFYFKFYFQFILIKFKN